MFFAEGHKKGIRLLRKAAETPTDEGGAGAASAALSRGPRFPRCFIHNQGVKWIALRLETPRKYDSMIGWLNNQLRSLEGWKVLPGEIDLETDTKGVASGMDCGATGSTLDAAPAPGPATKRPAPASSQGQADSAAVADSAAGRMPQRSLALKLAKIVGADAPQKKCRWSLDGDVLGKGSFGEVRRCTHPVEGQVAVKVFRGGPEFGHLEGLREATALVAIPEHENILRLLDVDTHFDKAVLVYPLFEGPLSLWTQSDPRKPRMSEEGRYQVAVGLLRAVAHLHCHGIVHTDVKPPNVLVGLPGGSRDSSGAPRARLRSKVSFSVVLADFGSSVPTQPEHRCQEKEDGSELAVATLGYRAPELAFGDVNYGVGVDSWACACTLLELALAEPMWPRLGQDSFSSRAPPCPRTP